MHPPDTSRWTATLHRVYSRVDPERTAIDHVVASRRRSVHRSSPAMNHAQHAPGPLNGKFVPGAEESRLRAFVDAPEEVAGDDLAACWRAFVVSGHKAPLKFYRSLAQAMLNRDAPVLAYDVTNAGLPYFPRDLKLRRLQALALARSGAAVSAHELAHALYLKDPKNEETLGLLARTHKDLAFLTDDAHQRRQHLEKAAKIYEQAYQETKGCWSGINAATLAALRGDHEHAARLAAKVGQQCRKELPKTPRRQRYWLVATLGEAALILGHAKEAADWYRQAGQLAKKQFGQLASTRRHAR